MLVTAGNGQAEARKPKLHETQIPALKERFTCATTPTPHILSNKFSRMLIFKALTQADMVRNISVIIFGSDVPHKEDPLLYNLYDLDSIICPKSCTETGSDG